MNTTNGIKPGTSRDHRFVIDFLLLRKLVDTDLTFCQLRLLGHLSSTPVAERFGWPQWLQTLLTDRLYRRMCHPWVVEAGQNFV